ncbi:hypothetical protein WS62_20750 [Burkholderia sp. ABCPW 14]|nr:hypothetical protein WS62_20750 [Burkholderia sp. ABCPW 14]
MLRLNGLVEHWSEVGGSAWLAPLLQWEEGERTQRSLQRRIRAAKLGKFKILTDFDWDWPKRIDRMAVEELMSLSFLDDATMPKYHWSPFLLWCISGPRSPEAFLVELKALTSVASTTVPAQRQPLVAKDLVDPRICVVSWCFSSM